MLETAALNLKIRHQNEGKISKRYKLRLSKKHSKKANRISRPNSKKTNKNKEKNRQWRILNPPLKWQKRLKRDKENLTAWIECSRYYSNSASWYRFPTTRSQERREQELILFLFLSAFTHLRLCFSLCSSLFRCQVKLDSAGAHSSLREQCVRTEAYQVVREKAGLSCKIRVRCNP